MSLVHQIKTSHAFQSFRSSIPQELLLLIFHHLTPFQRCLLLSICKSWNQILLSTKSFWQILDVPFRLEISTTTISILQLFGSRSGYTLKQVVFENVFYESQAHLDHLDSLFQELEKSSNSLKVLVIPQSSSLNKVTRHFVREFLPNLKFLYSHNHARQLERISEMRKHLLEWGSQYLIEERNDQGKQSVEEDDDDEEEATFEEEQKTGGLEFYLCSEISDIKRFEEDWFRDLKIFETYEIDSVKSFLRILNAAKSSLKHLNLKELEWPGRILNDEWRPVGEDLTEVVLENSKLQFIVPKLQGTSNSLSKLIKFQSPDLRIIGPAQALIHFEFNSLKFAEISLYDDRDDQSYSWDTVDGDRVLDNTFSFLKDFFYLGTYFESFRSWFGRWSSSYFHSGTFDISLGIIL